MSSFEVIDFIPPYLRTSRHKELFEEMIKNLSKLKPDQSLRKEVTDIKAAFSLMAAARSYLKKEKLDEEYFVTVRQKQDEKDGKFYTYFGKRK